MRVLMYRFIIVVVLCSFFFPLFHPLLAPSRAYAQSSYRFRVEKNISHIYINEDGSIDVEYFITFHNVGSPVDVVDIGLPHTGYRLKTAKADIDGIALDNIRKSTEIPVGVEVHLGPHAIPTGQKGTVHFRINNPRMIFPDTEDPEYASLEFGNTWFDPGCVVGRTYVEINVHFPPGVSGTESRYHDVKFTRASRVGDRLVFTWVKENATQKKHMVGVSFPRKHVNKVFDPSEVTFKPKKPFNWIAFFEWAPYIFIAVIVVVAVLGGYLVKRSKRMHYFPPETRIEGLGARKDLEPIEAAAVLELPLSRIIALTMLQLVQKGAIEVVQVHPLQVNIVKKEDLKLSKYEEKVIKALEPSSFAEKEVRERRLTNAVVALIEDVRGKLKGYSRKATAEFYRGKIEYMWKKVESDPQLEHLSWISLDGDCARKIAEDPEIQKKVEPLWEEHYFGYYRPAQYRDNLYLWLDDAEHDVVPDNTDFTLGVSKSTNPRAWIVSSGWSSGGGGGSSCACACAGCACACAGGGR